MFAARSLRELEREAASPALLRQVGEVSLALAQRRPLLTQWWVRVQGYRQGGEGVLGDGFLPGEGRGQGAAGWL